MTAVSDWLLRGERNMSMVYLMTPTIAGGTAPFALRGLKWKSADGETLLSVTVTQWRIKTETRTENPDDQPRDWDRK